MAVCYLKILGPPYIAYRGDVLTLKRQKSLGILSYLSMTEHNVSRNQLASLFWPDSSESHALGALRTSLADIKALIPESILINSKEKLEINRRNVDCDAVLFRAKSARNGSLQELIEAESLWNGGLLKGFTLKGLQWFDDWKDLLENSLEQEYVQLLRSIARKTEELQDFDVSLTYRRKLLFSEPYDEENHRSIMNLYYLLGDRMAALKQYEICKKYLEEDLGFAIEEETEQLYRSILNGNRNQNGLKGMIKGHSDDDPGLLWRLHGYSMLKEYDPELQKQAEKSFRKALELNPRDADAWAGLGLSLLSLCHFGLFGADTDTLFHQAEEAARNALRIDPDQVTALHISGWIAEDYYWDMEEAEGLYNRALKLDPANTAVLVGQFSILLRKKKLKEALEIMDRINQINPCCGISVTSKFWCLLAARLYGKASLILEEVRPFLRSDSLEAFFKALIKLVQKNYDGARSIMEDNLDRLLREGKTNLLFVLAYAYAAVNERDAALAIISLMKEGRSSLRGISIPIASIYTLWGDYETAMDLVDAAIEKRDTSIYFLIYLPFYDPLYSFPRFRDQMKKANFSNWV